MIKAQHNFWARTIFNYYIDYQFKKYFNGFYLVNSLPNLDTNKSVVVLPNHFSWWDGFLIDYINRKLLKRKFYILMLEEQLKRYWFFNYLGAFSINLNNPKSIITTINYFKELAKDSNNIIVFYPQGKIEPFQTNNITFKNGIVKFTKGVENYTQLLPISFKFQYYEDKKPFILCSFGTTINNNDVFNEKNIFDIFLANLQNLEKEALNKNLLIKV